MIRQRLSKSCPGISFAATTPQPGVGSNGREASKAQFLKGLILGSDCELLQERKVDQVAAVAAQPGGKCLAGAAPPGARLWQRSNSNAGLGADRLFRMHWFRSGLHCSKREIEVSADSRRGRRTSQPIHAAQAQPPNCYSQGLCRYLRCVFGLRAMAKYHRLMARCLGCRIDGAAIGSRTDQGAQKTAGETETGRQRRCPAEFDCRRRGWPGSNLERFGYASSSSSGRQAWVGLQLLSVRTRKLGRDCLRDRVNRLHARFGEAIAHLAASFLQLFAVGGIPRSVVGLNRWILFFALAC